MNKVKINSSVFSLLLLTALATLTYLPLVPFLGFYSEDFFFSYAGHFNGLNGLIKTLSIDRPFNGYLLGFVYLLLGDNVFLWHIYTFLIRLAGGYALFFTLRKIWPSKLFSITILSALFLTYPGFLQQTLPLGYNVLITTLTIWIFSLMSNLYAIKNKEKIKSLLLTSIALILQINSFLQFEFFVGMEILRFLLIFNILKVKINPTNLKKKLKYWSPYIITLTLFILWRIFIFKGSRPETDIYWVTKTYYNNPIWALKIPLEIIYSFVSTVIFSFFITLFINFIRLPLEISLILIALSTSLSLFLLKYYKNFQEENDRKFDKNLLLIGLISIIGALIPIIISGRMIRIFNVYDRYTITNIIGVGFIIVGFLKLNFNKKIYQFFLILLIALSVSSHSMNAYWHKIMWDKQKDLWWQLYWRSPRIENNSLIILNFPPVSENILFKDIINRVKWYRFYWAVEQIWTAGNLFFNYNNPPKNHFTGDFLAGDKVIDKIKKGQIETFENRTMQFTKNYKNVIIVSTPSDSSCLWVLNKNTDELPIHANNLLKSSIIYSNPDKLIKADHSTTPPKEIFGEEPPHDWCYYFQKASLARQFKDWDKLSQLKDEVMKKNLKPKDPNEWLPFTKDLR